MADILGLGGYNPSTGLPILFAAYGNDLVNLSNGLGYNQNLTLNSKMEFASFLDCIFAVNGVDNTRRFQNGRWLDEVTRKHAPIAKYILSARTRLFLAGIKFGSNTFASRVMFSDLPANNDITYGLEYGTDLVTYPNNTTVASPSAYFITRNIKAGDPLTITAGLNVGEYTVAKVNSETTLTLVEALPYAATSQNYWVSRNWIDVNTNDGDVLTGIGENDDRALFFKRRSLHRYDGSSLKKVKGVPGTTSHRSIANVRGYTFYYNNGVWRYDGTTSDLISRGVQDYFDGVDPSFYDKVVGWKVGNDIYRIFLGNIYNAETGLTKNNCIIDFDMASQTVSPGTISNVITCNTDWITSGVDDAYLGTNANCVLKDNTGYQDNGNPIAWDAVLPTAFPVNADTDTEFSRMEVHAERHRGVKLAYRFYGSPTEYKKDWETLGELRDPITELIFDRQKERFARGIDIKLMENSSNIGPIITRIDIFHKPRTKRVIDKERNG